MIIVALTDHEPQIFGEPLTEADAQTRQEAGYAKYLADITAEVHNRDVPETPWVVTVTDDYTPTPEEPAP